MSALAERIQAAHAKLSAQLLGERINESHWPGELSSSALSTAVATIALGKMGETDFVPRGLAWLVKNVNQDGGWGDTTKSQSNLSTTALVWAAFSADESNYRSVISGAEAWLWRHAGSRENLPNAITACYGKDRTFSVPILMTLALSGRLPWNKVPALPFELAAFPRGWFGALQLPVVSYALPALIAIGQTIHHHAPTKNPIPRAFRNLTANRTLKILTELQPSNGGFLEATPLTAFVTMSLAGMGHASHIVAQRGAAFLRTSMRGDGSWPIDTNLATWLTTLSIKALATPQPNALRDWLLNQQFKVQHPYTGAAPGGWAWTDLPGGVPDADDTAGALIALHILDSEGTETKRAAAAGLQWLLGLQNRDGGFPTFCRGWGALPFDRSTPEITAHALRAFHVWNDPRPTTRALAFLRKNQRPDGAWIPLWFGNESAPDHENPVYGTAQTLISLNEIALEDSMRDRAAKFLLNAQLPTGGWGGAPGTLESIEETAVALEALSGANTPVDPLRKGAHRLLDLLEKPTPAPIGLYFARLWYFERLYPLIFSVSALRKLVSKQL